MTDRNETSNSMNASCCNVRAAECACTVAASNETAISRGCCCGDACGCGDSCNCPNGCGCSASA